MSRAWPFEEKPEPPPVVREPEDFLAQAPAVIEAVVVRIGLRDAQLVLVDGEGGWKRWVYPTVERATQVAESLGVAVHVGGYPETVRVRMNGRRRSAKDFDRGAYPEQGDVGPVISYRENRPRQLAPSRSKEADPQRQ
ncbi:MAG: hypothetical protein QOH48_1513 [Actinomycetota bacterium]|jgi:hypothetical protein|nr:hypothetical protein [Actinomycetota bacterium]